MIHRVNRATKALAAMYGFKYNSYLTELPIKAHPFLNEKQLIFANNAFALLWLLDDLIDDPEVDIKKRMLVLEQVVDYLTTGRIAPKNNFIKLLESNEFWNGYRTSQTAKNYISRVVDMLKSGMLQKWKYDIYTPELYKQIRYYDSGCECVWPFLDFDVQIVECEATKLGNLIVSWVNDIYSYKKDVIRDGTNYNYLVAIGGDYETAKAAVELEVEIMWNRLQELAKTDHVAYLVNIWCYANLEWHDKSPRYKL